MSDELNKFQIACDANEVARRIPDDLMVVYRLIHGFRRRLRDVKLGPDYDRSELVRVNDNLLNCTNMVENSVAIMLRELKSVAKIMGEAEPQREGSDGEKGQSCSFRG